jgi:hypothetical protein
MWRGCVDVSRPLPGHNERERSGIFDMGAVIACALRTDQYSTMTDEVHEK